MAGNYNIESLYKVNLAHNDVALNESFILYTTNNLNYEDFFHRIVLNDNYRILNKEGISKFLTKEERKKGVIDYQKVLEIESKLKALKRIK